MLKLLLLLFPIVAIGSWFGIYRHKHPSEKSSSSVIPQDYFLGLNYLINEQPDKAVDVFIKMLEVNIDTVETHLALGSLFRRRGEVDRAIRVHQNIIARPQLARTQRIHALFELAQDYLRAGVLDRAERLFLELIEINGEVGNSLNSLINIYQQQKDWQQAINIAQQLEKLNKTKLGYIIAHYYCELAEQAWANHRNEQAYKYLQAALDQDKNCARANIVLGKLYIEKEEYKRAIDVLRTVYEQDVEYMSEAVPLLAECYKRINLGNEFTEYLQECIEKKPSIYFILAMVEQIRDKSGSAAAIEYLTGKIHNFLSIRGIECMLGLYINSVDPSVRDQFRLLKEYIDKVLEKKPIYRCTLCGFSGRQLYWQCPSCKRWNVVKPIHGLEIE